MCVAKPYTTTTCQNLKRFSLLRPKNVNNINIQILHEKMEISQVI